MNVVAWILQVILAVQYVYHGWIFVSPPPAMAGAMESMGIDPFFRQFIGAAELLAAVGLVFPALTRIQPWLTPLAALGLSVVMVSATIFHIVRGETSSAIFAAVLLVLVMLTGYLRWKVAPISRKAAPRLAHA